MFDVIIYFLYKDTNIYLKNQALVRLKIM
jgi:hypothetical protein